MKDELLGYAADVRLSAVSCLQIHLEIDFFFFLLPPPPPLSLSPSPSAGQSCKITRKLSQDLTEDSVIPLGLRPLCVVCMNV